MKGKAELFLSHSHSDGPLALLLADWLTKAFQDQLHVICTSMPDQKISQGMVTTEICGRVRASDAVMVLLTRTQADLAWVYYEMGCAHALQKPFIPCVAQGQLLSMLPPQAYEYQGIALDTLDDELTRDRLLHALGQILRVSPMPLSPPIALVQRARGY